MRVRTAIARCVAPPRVLAPPARRRSVALGLAFVALAVCARASAADLATLSPVLRGAYAAVAERHVDAPDLARFTAAGLRGLVAIDRDLALERERERLVLRGPSGVLARAEASALASLPGAWEAAFRLIEAAVAASAPLRAQGNETLLRLFLNDALADLDPYSRYVPRSEARAARMRRFGEAGLGLELAPEGGAAVVRRVIDDSPAWAAGLRPGDRVLAIDGRTTRGLDAEALQGLLRGEENEPLTLTVARRGGRSETVVLVRAMVAAETVFVLWHGTIPVLRVSGFNRLTDRRLARAVVEVAHRDPAPPGLVLDLRGNRGGLLRQAIAAADLFLSDGVIAEARGRHPDASRVHRASGPDLAAGLPIVVLVDGSSASSAEVLAAALQDNGRAALVGSVTTGKGLIQTVVPLADDSEVHLTWASLHAPSGYPIQGLGVLPDVCTSRGETAMERDLRRRAAGQGPEAGGAWRAVRERPAAVGEIARLRDVCPPSAGGELDIAAALWLLRGAALDQDRSLAKRGSP
ncbi:MAG: S41 family peptidase [Acetobacteraceae bacterium]|nr:S41 family peptidase [Acetobacteraceae bacterium]